jgi:dihydrolipoamide dehydrogenase
MADSEYDVIVLGAGPAGENAADRAVKGGLTAVIVEAELVGGECSYWACMPSKALLRSPQAVEEARAVDGARQAVVGAVDAAAVLARRNKFTHNWQDDGQVRWLDSAHIAFVRGRGRLAGEKRVEVTGADGQVTRLTARQAVVIATGSDAAIPPVPGLAEARPWTSREATSAQRVPERLAVIGGGVVACEMATAWRALGAGAVTMLVRSRLLGNYEPFVSEQIAAAMRTQGIDVRLGVNPTEVRRPGGEGPLTMTLDDGSSLTADEVLVATGRRPRTIDIGLETAGLAPGKWLDVDDTCQVTGVPGGWLYAIGDVNHRALLTHMGKYQARACGDVIAARARGDAAARDPAPWSHYAATAYHGAVPQVVFTNPEVGAVGLTEAEARNKGLPVKAVEYEIGQVAGAALYADGYRGRAKLVVDERRRVIVGATFVGPAVGELVHAATIAVVGEVPLDRLWHAVPSYPTISEVWLRLLETYGL